jgi:simple sugar transport system ATP-binding protein
VIELRDITKTYRENGVRALSGVDFSLEPGEIHTVAGENGAGKSTLMHVLGGYLKPDSGKILVNGQPRHFPLPASALRAGIGMVRQRPSLVDTFSVWENCALGVTMKSGGDFFFDRRKARDATGAMIEKLGFRLPLDAKAGTLTLAGQKKTAVLSLVMRGASYFIFDEPFAYLRHDEKDEMRSLFLSLRNEEKGVAVIAHEIREILPVSDRVTVLRNGRVALAGDKSEVDEARVIRAMFADSTDTPPVAARTAPSARTTETAPSDGGNKRKEANGRGETGKKNGKNETALSVRNLCVNQLPFYPLEHISLEARRGEITGIAGMRESGVETLELALAGLLEPEGGSIEAAAPLNGRNEARTAYIGLGGSAEAFAPSLSVRDNLILHEHQARTGGRNHGRGWHSNGWNNLGFLDTKALAAFATSLVEKAGLSASVSIAAPASSLSGGMLARIIVERELAKDADVLLLSDPSAGLDLRALNTLLQKIRAFADSGGAVILFLSGVSPHETGNPSGTHELAGLCDRLYALESGRLYALEDGRLSLIEHGRGFAAEKESRGR